MLLISLVEVVGGLQLFWDGKSTASSRDRLDVDHSIACRHRAGALLSQLSPRYSAALDMQTCWCAGNAPTMMSLEDLQHVAPIWMNTSHGIFDDEEAHKVLTDPAWSVMGIIDTPKCPICQKDCSFLKAHVKPPSHGRITDLPSWQESILQ